MLPDPFDVLEATLGPAAGVVRLGEERRVVRTTDRPDHPAGNAVHHRAAVTPDGLAAVVADLDRRFPRGRARLVLPHDPELVTADHAELLPTVIEVLRRDPGAAPPRRADLALAAPVGDRDWHGITVLHRHAAAPGEDRARGRQDERLRWWVAGLRELVETGRARVLRAVRFGTPVGVGVLHWVPGAVVGEDHAGLAVVADVVVHPAHRGIGVARSLTEALVEQHLADFPRARVTAVAEHAPQPPRGRSAGDAPDPDPTAVPTGWQLHARLLALTRGAA